MKLPCHASTTFQGWHAERSHARAQGGGVSHLPRGTWAVAPDAEKAPPPPLAKDDGERALQAQLSSAHVHIVHYLQISIFRFLWILVIWFDIIHSEKNKNINQFTTSWTRYRWTGVASHWRPWVSLASRWFLGFVAAMLWWANKGYKSLSDQA